MGIVSKFTNMFKKSAVVRGEDFELSTHIMPMSYQHYIDNQYENGYSSIKAIANSFLSVRPYAIDENGKKVKANAIDKIYHPNQSMSGVEFREALAIMCLVHPKVYILHWHMEDGKLVAGGQVAEETIAGFTFLEGVTERQYGSEIIYQYNNQTFTKQDLLILKGINPYCLNEGYAPASAAKRWTKLDDYIADYQAGFFENGAVPSGMFVIRAKSPQDFKDIKKALQDKNKGAGKNNNVTYSYAPIDTNGVVQSSQIEWIPFNTTTKDMALKDIFAQVNQKIDSAYGVPASIRGVNDANTYASVRVDEMIMAKYTVSPFLMKTWGRMTHELNRVTGGLGYAIAYDYEIPQMADEKLIVAQTKSTEAQAISSLSLAGYETQSIITALALPESYKALVEKPKAPVIEDNPDIDMGDEVKDTPEQPLKDEPIPKKVKKLTTVDRKSYEKELSDVVEKHTELQVNRAIATLDIQLKSKAYGDTTEAQDDAFADDMLTVITPLIIKYGDKANKQGIKLILEAGLDTEPIKGFVFNDAQKAAYTKYLERVATSYDDETAMTIRRILGDGITAGATRTEIEQQLKQTLIGSANKYRVDRLSKTEINLSEGRASVMAMNDIQKEIGYKIYKVWTVNSADPCEYCQSMNGTEVLVGENFIDLGHEVHGVDGGSYTTDFKDTDTASLHPNCTCYQTYRVEGN